MEESKYGKIRYGTGRWGAGSASDSNITVTGGLISGGSVNLTNLTVWETFKMTVRKGLGVVASLDIDATDSIGSVPTVIDRFTIVMPTGEKFVLIPVSVQQTTYRGDGSATPIITYSYDLIDIVTALDRIPLPQVEFIESTSGEIVATLIPLLDATLFTDGIATGNVVPYLNTNDFSKFSDVMRQTNVAAGNYIYSIDPLSHDGLGVRADFQTNFGSSGMSVDGTSSDFTPAKEPIVPDTQIINYQRVRGIESGGPHNTVSEARELAALNPTFDFGAIPYGIDAQPLLNVSMDGGDISGTDDTNIPKIIPLHYPTQIQVSDISLTGTGVVCGFIGRGNTTLLGVSVGSSSIGAVVSGTTYSEPVPFIPNGPVASDTKQYYYDWAANFTTGGLEISVIENFLDSDAGSESLATVGSIVDHTITLVLPIGRTVADLPESIRFFAAGDPSTVLGFTTIKSRSGNTIEIDPVPEGLAIGDELASGDGSTVTVTEKIVYSGAAPSNRYGKPQLIISGGSGITATGWGASYGPAIEAILEDNPYTGVSGRRLRVDTTQSKLSDIVVSKSGNGAIGTFVSDRLPLTGVNRILLNYDEAKRSDVVVQDAGSQALYGIRQGDIIDSSTAVTDEECTAIGQAVIDDFAHPKPKGTIFRESIFTANFPMPPQTFAVSVPSEYLIDDAIVPISETSVEFIGGIYDSVTDRTTCVLGYHITLGELDSVELVNRELLAKQADAGLGFRPLMATGPRISSFTWNDVDTVTLGISGSIALAGKAASSSFNPADYATGNLRETPVFISGTVTSGGIVHKLFVEVIYPPLPVDADSAKCHYSPKTNLITYTWGRPSGGDEYLIQRLIDEDNDPLTPPTWKQVDDIFQPTYPLPYEPDSRSIKVKVLGLGEKESGDYVQIECTLPTLPAPSPFEVVKVKPGGKIFLRVGAPPTGFDITGRAEFLRVFVLRKDQGSANVTTREEFNVDSDDANIYTLKLNVSEGISRYIVHFKDTDADDVVWISGAWVDRFGDEGTFVTPFDATNPTVTAGSISLTDFFQTAPQVLGGTIEDDDGDSPGVDFTGKFRVRLGQNNSYIIGRFQESSPTNDIAYTVGTWLPDAVFHTHAQDITDTDVANGYVDIVAFRKFRWGKKRHRTYRPTEFKFYGPKIRERGVNNSEATREVAYLVGYEGTPPALVNYQTDALFDKTLFQFQPGIAGLANSLTTVTGGKIRQKDDGFIYDWDVLDEIGVRRYILLISTNPFGTKGPGQDITIVSDGTDTPGVSKTLNAIRGTGIVTVYNVANTIKNVDVTALDLNQVGKNRFHNGDIIGGITITSGTTYFVSVLAQKGNGRWSVNFATILNTTSGAPVSIGDAAAPGPVTSLTLNWKNSKGFRARWEPPTLNSTSLQYFYGVFYNDSGSTIYMNPDTGQQMAGGTTEAQAKFKIIDNSYIARLNRSDLDILFASSGVKFKVWAVNLVNGVLTEAGTGDKVAYPTLVPAGSDSSAPAVDLGVPDIVTGTVKWRSGKGILVNVTPGTTNDKTIHRYGYYFFYPRTANGTTVARNCFNPDTGADTGIVSTGSTTATFGVGGNSEFFSNSRFDGHALKAQLPAGAISGGIGVCARAYNYTNGSTGAVETTNPTTTFGTSSIVDGITFAVSDTDFPSDRAGANWINSSTGATASQAGLVLSINKKAIKLKWDAPQHLVSSPDAVPLSVYKYGIYIQAGDISPNFLDPENPGTPANLPVEFFSSDTRKNLNILRSELASVFRTQGLIFGIRCYNYVNGVSTASTFTTPTSSQQVPADSTSEDTAAATAVQNLLLTWGNSKGFKSVWDRPASNINSIKGYKVSYSNNAGTSFMNPNTGGQASPNTETGGTIFVPNTYHTTHLRFTNLHADFQAGVRVKVTPVNVVLGVETDGAVATFPTPPTSVVPPVKNDSRIEDIAAASAVLTLDLRWNNKKGYKSFWARPTTNINSLIGYKVVYFNGNDFMNPLTGAKVNSGVPATDEVLTTVFQTDPNHTTHLKKSELDTTFQTNGVRVKVTPVNIVAGVETNGTSTTSSIILPTEADLPFDTTQPSAPVVDVLRSSGKVTIHASVPTSNATTRLEYQMALSAFSSAATATNPTTNGSGTPTIGVNGVLKTRSSNNGTASFNVYKSVTLTGTDYFVVYTRCKNAVVTTWSDWTRFDLGFRNQLDRPLTDEQGSGVPNIDRTFGAPGDQNIAANGVGSGIHYTHTGAEFFQDENTLEWSAYMYPANDDTAYSINAVQIQLKKRQNARTKRDLTFGCNGIASYAWTSPTSPVFRYRWQNTFIDNGLGGYSEWSGWVDVGANFTPFGDSSGDITPSAIINPNANPPVPAIG